MFKNYLKIAWRNISRNKVNSFINIAGLSVGMTCVILILLYVQDEKKYDRFFEQADRIYQVNMENIDNGNVSLTGNTAPAVGPAMVNEFPEIETYVRIHRPGDKMVRYEHQNKTGSYFTEKRILGVDSNFLQVFTYKTVEGDPLTCLKRPNSIVITKKTAERYFGSPGYQHAIGKILLVGNEKSPFEITAVLDDIPSQSSFQFDMLVPISTNPNVEKRSWNWWWLQVSTYVKLGNKVPNDKASLERLEARFPGMAKKYAFERNPMTFEEFTKKGNKLNFHLLPLTSVHLYAAGMGTPARLTTLGDIKYVRIFSFIALIIIILACVNFMNLSTAQSAKRAKEVGIRKVLGSVRKQLIKQFLLEAIFYSLISAIIALLLVLVLLKPFNEVAGKTLDFSLLFKDNLWVFVTGLSVLTGLLAGSYPAFYLTSFRPINVLKGIAMFKSRMGDLFVRHGLVVFQFTISITLIIATIIVFKQLQFTRNKDLGFDRENMLVISNTERLGEAEESFRQELTKLPFVENAAVTTGIPVSENFGDVYVPVPADAGEQVIKEIGLSSFIVDDDFVPTLDIQLVRGRNFSKDFSDSASVIINETAANQIGWKDPVGQTLEYPGNSQVFKVIGVARDFNIGSLHTPIVPFALFYSTSQTYGLDHSYMLVRMKAGNLGTHLSSLQDKWKKFAPNTPFDFSFLDSDLDVLYRSEKRMGAVFIIFTILSIFIACLGLFGLAAYTAERRVKEIGIRKVLGASVHGLVALLTKDFVKLVILSTIIAFPVAWWFMHQWLQDFAYRISIGWWIFIVAGLLALAIALITVSFQAIRAAIADPVTSLRTE